ncbi:MAG: Asp-tRNA(Asn)/Glu-tRNA(Gln) amidotransferase subunit GatC [Clostridiales bacterium]|nr:Asp-tRNA(Asn)/Glu-tRNA(Gln) amidotransferase subunit GatC [Clostridiales bacterium]
MVSLEEVEYIANLAKLKFSEEEKIKMQEDLSNILDYMKVLNDIDTKDIEVEGMMSTNLNVMRKDENIKFEDSKRILENSVTSENFIIAPEK